MEGKLVSLIGDHPPFEAVVFRVTDRTADYLSERDIGRVVHVCGRHRAAAIRAPEHGAISLKDEGKRPLPPLSYACLGLQLHAYC